MNIAPGLRSANGATPPRRSAKGRVAVSPRTARRVSRDPRGRRPARVPTRPREQEGRDRLAEEQRDRGVWFPSASDASKASFVSAAPSRRASRSSRRRSTHESPCRKRMCSAVVAASRAARASSANVVSTANNAPVRARSTNPTLTRLLSSSSAPQRRAGRVAPESDRVAPRSARIKPFIARVRARRTSSLGYTRRMASTFSPEFVSSIATLRTERSIGPDRGHRGASSFASRGKRGAAGDRERARRATRV